MLASSCHPQQTHTPAAIRGMQPYSRPLAMAASTSGRPAACQWPSSGWLQVQPHSCMRHRSPVSAYKDRSEVPVTSSLESTLDEDPEAHSPEHRPAPVSPSRVTRQPPSQRAPLSSYQQQKQQKPVAQARAVDARGPTSDPDPDHLQDLLPDINPAVLESMGYTGVTHFLQQRAGLAVQRAKLSCCAAALWGAAAAGVTCGALGGSLGYHADLSVLTDGGVHPGNIGFLWVAVLSYFSVKSSVNMGVQNVRAWWMLQQHEAQEDLPQELQGAEVDEAGNFKEPSARLAWWSLQEQLHRADKAGERAFSECALSCGLLGLQLLALGGPDLLQLQLEALDQEAYCRLIIRLWLFWETYFAGIAAVVALSKMGHHYWRLWRYQQLQGSTRVVDEVVEQAQRIMRGE